ncbi:MAG: hypothetical protein KGH75_00745 [Rhodospirillales bacterium]|nr:hypothetical protein [Rhodospirillales bacterium]
MAIQYIRMLADREGAWDHIHIVTYQAGEIYSLDRTDPPISQDLLDGFVASGHAMEVDADGNPVGMPADTRQTKPSGPKATKATSVADAPAPRTPDVSASDDTPV